MMVCPACQARLQPLSPSTEYVKGALEYCQRMAVVIPSHGPAALVFLALVSHAMVVHDDLDLDDFMEAYLGS